MWKEVLVGTIFSMSLSSAHAATVTPTSYDMVNGGTGSYIYRDESYSGVGATGNPNLSYTQLSGGLGDLTDGVIATQSWNANRQTSSTPYVGWWQGGVANPTISFFFDAMYSFNSLTVYYDVSYTGGVGPITNFDVGFTSATIAAPGSRAPTSYTLDLEDYATDTLSLTLSNPYAWIFVSEVTFDGAAVSPVPLPASGLLLIAALAGIGVTRRRKAA